MVAVGRLSLSYSDLFNYDMDDLNLMLEGKDYELQQMWEASRLAGVLSLTPHSKKPLEPSKLYKFPWEQKGVKLKPITDTDFDKFRELHNKIKNGKVTS